MRFLLLLFSLAYAVEATYSQPNDSRDDSYVEWSSMDADEKAIFCTASLVAAFYWASKVYDRNPTMDPFMNLPVGITNLQVRDIVDRIYKKFPQYRTIPYIVIIMEPLYWYQFLGGPVWQPRQNQGS